MFYQSLESPPVAEGDQDEEKWEIQLRKRSDSSPASFDSRGVGQSNASRSRISDSLEKIVETDETDGRDARTEYKLAGYLYKIPLPNKLSVPGLKGLGSTPKKRWFVYSDSVCKLYYYKQKNDTEPLGIVDISLATFFFDPENRNEGQFNIRWGNKEIMLEAPSARARMYWLQQLQAARREFSQRRTAAKTPSSRTSTAGRPGSGLIQDDNSSPVPTPDPHYDLKVPMVRPASLDTPPRSSTFSDAKHALSNFLPNTQRIFKSSSESSSKSPVSPQSSRLNLLASPTEDLSFGNLGRKLRSSLRVRKPPEGKEGADSPFVHQKTPHSCRQCGELQKEIISLQDSLSAIQDEYQASRDGLDVLQTELKALQQEKATLISLDRSDLTDHHVLEILRGKDRRIITLEHENQMLTNQLAVFQEKLSAAHAHHDHLSEKLSMLYCLVEAKDKAIVSLTHQVDEANAFFPPNCPPPPPPPNVPEVSSSGTQTSNTEEDALRDALEAYKGQNIFLNKEILELNFLRKHSAEREDKLITESSEWEAKFYQIQSKYLLLLNELHSPQASQQDHTIISQLLKDVVGAHGPPDLRVIHNKGREYDEYGFCITAPDDGTLEAKATYIQKQSQALAQQLLQGGSSWENKWESFLAGTSAKELPTCPELKYLIRGGIPYQYKGKVWRLLVEARVHPLKAAIPSNYYQDQLSRRSTSATLDSAAKQIELDLLRTLPNNRHYEAFHSDGTARLRRVLLAFSRHNTKVGYCQGLNRLAAIALLFLNEEDAFWCLVYIVEYLMPPDYYNKNLLGSQVDQRVLKDLVAEKLPRLSNHLELHGLDISLFTFNWFLCVYIDIIPPVTYLTIWDSFLCEGSKVLFRYALAIFKLCEEGILERCDYMEIFNYLRSVPDPITDIPRLQEVAFHWVNPLPMRYLRAKRAHHTAIVKAELAQVEKVRRSYHITKAANAERAEEVTGSPTSTIDSPRTSDDEGEGDMDSPVSPSSSQAVGGRGEGEGERDVFHFEVRKSCEKLNEVKVNPDKASAEWSDKGRE